MKVLPWNSEGEWLPSAMEFLSKVKIVMLAVLTKDLRAQTTGY
jgi:hypothetical protein